MTDGTSHTDEHVERIVRAANAALLGEHTKLSIAYLATRVTELEREQRRLSKEVLGLSQSLSAARTAYAEQKRATEAAADAHREQLAAVELEWARRFDQLTKPQENGHEREATTETGADRSGSQGDA